MPPRKAKAVKVPTVKIGSYEVPLTQIEPHSETDTTLYKNGDYEKLVDILDERGYIFIRNVINIDTIHSARKTILGHLETKQALRSDRPDPLSALISIDQSNNQTVAGWTIDADSGGVNGDRESEDATEGWKKVGRSKALHNVYRGEELLNFYNNIFSSSTKQSIKQSNNQSIIKSINHFPDCTWLRIRGVGDSTSEHADYYYFKQERTIFGDHWPARILHQSNNQSNNHSEQSNNHSDHECESETETTIKQFRKRTIKQSAKQPAKRIAKTKESINQSNNQSMEQTCFKCNESVDQSNKPSTKRHVAKCSLCHKLWHRECADYPPTVKQLINQSNNQSSDQTGGEWHCDECADSPFPFYTCWIALGPVRVEHGRLALVPGTHKLKGYASTKTKLPKEWNKTLIKQSIWHMSDMGPGDLILFNMKTIHAATANSSSEFRMSLDTRCMANRILN